MCWVLHVTFSRLVPGWLDCTEREPELKWTSLRVGDSGLLMGSHDCFSMYQLLTMTFECVLLGKAKWMCTSTYEDWATLEEGIFGTTCRKWVMSQAQKAIIGQVTTQNALLLTLWFSGELPNCLFFISHMGTSSQSPVQAEWNRKRTLP